MKSFKSIFLHQNILESSRIQKFHWQTRSDPQTPFPFAPFYLSKIQKNPERQFLVSFENEVHGIISKGDCPLNIISSFFKNPKQKPDISCIQQMPNLDWEGSSEYVKKISKEYFGIENIWEGI